MYPICGNSQYHSCATCVSDPFVLRAKTFSESYVRDDGGNTFLETDDFRPITLICCNEPHIPVIDL